jgi:hypothetical protein
MPSLDIVPLISYFYKKNRMTSYTHTQVKILSSKLSHYTLIVMDDSTKQKAIYSFALALVAFAMVIYLLKITL